MEAPKDSVGQHITPGCFIAYAYICGNSAGIRVARVLEVRQRDKKRYSSGLRWSIKVQAVGLERASALQSPENMVVLDPTKIREDYLRELGTDSFTVMLEKEFAE